MLTSYLVKCPHPGCDWFGSLLPERPAGGFGGPVLKPSEVLFQCPQCLGEWRARKAGDDVVTVGLVEEVPLPLA